MKITYLAHASFKIVTESGLRILTDPYEAGSFNGAVKYAPIREEADVVLKSHDHADHNAVKGLPGKPVVLDKSGEVKGVRFEAVPTFHDAEKGKLRGRNTAFRFTADGVSVAFLGDLGHELDKDQVAKLKPVHVLLVPVGGFFTIDAAQAARVADALEALVIVPMHYKTPRLGFDIATAEPFLKLRKNVRRAKGSTLDITTDTLPNVPETVLLDPSL